MITAKDFVEASSPNPVHGVLADLKANKLHKHVYELMRRFAKLHVKAALEAAYNNASMKEEEKGDKQICHTCTDMGDAFVLDKDSIINAYDLNNIK